MPNVIDLLKADHRKVEELFAKFESAEEHEKAELVKTILHELKVHTGAEETHVYPHLDERDPESEELEDHAQHEHSEIKEHMEHLEVLDEGFDEEVAKLKETVTHHVEEEETKLFPHMEEVIPELLDEMGTHVEQYKAEHA